MPQENSIKPTSHPDLSEAIALLVARVDHLTDELNELKLKTKNQTLRQNQDYEPQDPVITSVALRLLAARSRRTRLQTAVRDFVQLLQDNEDCHVSEILEAFGDYALHESSKIPDLQQTWEMVATFLKAAATEAETRGRELP